jgi:hypothetical protein
VAHLFGLFQLAQKRIVHRASVFIVLDIDDPFRSIMISSIRDEWAVFLCLSGLGRLPGQVTGTSRKSPVWIPNPLRHRTGTAGTWDRDDCSTPELQQGSCHAFVRGAGSGYLGCVMVLSLLLPLLWDVTYAHPNVTVGSFENVTRTALAFDVIYIFWCRWAAKPKAPIRWSVADDCSE